jgi:hypothetical protein
MAERVQNGPQQSRARRCSGAAQRTLDGEDRSERITGGRKGSLIPAYSPTKIPEFPEQKGHSPAILRPSVKKADGRGERSFIQLVLFQ